MLKDEKMDVKQMINEINREKINTWFDLGLYLDKFKENKAIPTAEFNGTYNGFTNSFKSKAMAFVTFHYSIDGVTIEVEKYAKILRNKFKGIEIHYIAGEFFAGSKNLLDSKSKKYELDHLKGFDNWELYKDFFFYKT